MHILSVLIFEREESLPREKPFEVQKASTTTTQDTLNASQSSTF